MANVASPMPTPQQHQTIDRYAGLLRALFALCTAICPIVASPSSPIKDTGQTRAYEYAIQFPELSPELRVLDRALRDYAATAKQQFIDDNANADADDPDYRKCSLDIRFEIVTKTARFVSVRALGSNYAGGMHTNPFYAGFNLGLREQTILQLGDLFINSKNALTTIAPFCQSQVKAMFEDIDRQEAAKDPSLTAELDKRLADMRVWVDKGAAPTEENYRVFTINAIDDQAIGIQILFQPYQVGPYSQTYAGTECDVPAALLATLLKKRYRNAFAIPKTAGNP